MKTTLSTFALAAAFSAAPSFADTAGTNTISTPVSQEAPAAWQPEDGDQIVFNVLRKGKEFGTHKISFDVESDDSFTARSDVELKAGLGPITVFKYELDATETWKNGKLVRESTGGSSFASLKDDKLYLISGGTGFLSCLST